MEIKNILNSGKRRFILRDQKRLKIILLPKEVHNQLAELATIIDSEENFDIFEKPKQIEPLIEEHIKR